MPDTTWLYRTDVYSRDDLRYGTHGDLRIGSDRTLLFSSCTVRNFSEHYDTGYKHIYSLRSPLSAQLQGSGY
jgi:hypothetical protein